LTKELLSELLLAWRHCGGRKLRKFIISGNAHGLELEKLNTIATVVSAAGGSS
jgi:hypothetical protein